MISTLPSENPLKPPEAAVPNIKEPDLSVENLAALQEDIHRMENPNFAVQKQKVREMFERGVPFFTRSAMEQLKHQIDSIKSMNENGESTDGQKFVFSSVTGQRVERAVLKGLTRSRHFGQEKVLYSDQALCPLQICYGGQSELDQFRSLEGTRDALHASLKLWQTSEDCARLKSCLSTASLPGITKIIAFACSSIARDVDHTRHRSATQHALLLTLRDILQAAQPGIEITCIAQDPIYTDIDKVVLSEHGVEVLYDPEGFIEVDDQSVVLSFSPNVPVRQIITDLARPVILAWDTVLTEEQTINRWARVHDPPKTAATAEDLEACLCDPESSRVRAMIREEYVDVHRLDDKEFGDASIYIRDDEKRR
ncbi:hypothetical protein N8I77_013330 [Diaporthe amygdali]|uniref:SRR1-like domain-containing protein n=1 Tax=Phomopsis amygdali TaxID=1214568 RepID=A0AAD9S183_PHOAM|nr:hypothetical protein N8I77_013330 [Diaporthe amygdali]